MSHLRPPVWATSGEVKRSREAANIIVIQKEANGGMTGHAFEAEDIASSSRLGGNSRDIHSLSNKLK